MALAVWLLGVVGIKTERFRRVSFTEPDFAQITIPHHPLASPSGSLCVTSQRGQKLDADHPSLGSIFHAETKGQHR